MQMTFGRMSEPLTKVQKVDSTKTAQSYDFMYKYEDSNHPTAPTQIGHDHYTYDVNGNPTLVENDSLGAETRKENGKIQLTVYVHPQGDAERRAYLSTESNVENILGVHELKGHGLLGIGSSQHWKILQMQRRHPSWKQTTPALRELYEYLEKNIPSEYYKH